MKRLVVLFLVVIMAVIAVNHSEASTKIDLKTKIDNKSKDYQAVKAGIIAMIKEDIAWIQLVEVGEKYSLWVKDLNMGNAPNNPLMNRIKFTLELRTPAMLGDGKLISSKAVQIDFKAGEALPFDNAPQLQRTMDRIQSEYKMSTGQAIMAFIGTGGISAMASLGVKVGSILQKGYSPVQQTAGVLSGYYVIGHLYEMLRETGDVQ